MLTFAVERADTCFEDIELLLPSHWNEIAHNKDVIKLDPDWARYRELDRNGLLHVATARDEDVLVGYCIFFVCPHIHYRESLTAISDVLYVSPEYRQGSAGYRFMKYAYESLKERGVQRVLANTKLKHDFGRILERLGFTEVERIYTKVL